MDIHTENEPEDVETQTEHGSVALHKSKKASFESNADVQRWLKEQVVEEGGSCFTSLETTAQKTIYALCEWFRRQDQLT